MERGGTPPRVAAGTERFDRARRIGWARLTDLADDDCTVHTAPQSEGLLGWSAAELGMICGRDLIHPDDRDAIEPLVERWAVTGRRIPYVPLVVRMLGRDQRYWWTGWRLSPSSNGVDAVGVHHLGPDSSVPPPVGLWRWDVDRDTVAWSKDLLDLLGGTGLRPASSYAGFLGAVHPEDRADVDRTMRRTLATDERDVVTFRCPLHPGRDRWFHASVRRTVAADGGVGVGGIVRYLNAPADRGRRTLIGSG
jgi:PAS domain-containing protein